jgi:hypothetical protein
MDHEGYRIREKGISAARNSRQNHDQFHQMPEDELELTPCQK